VKTRIQRDQDTRESGYSGNKDTEGPGYKGTRIQGNQDTGETGYWGCRKR